MRKMAFLILLVSFTSITRAQNVYVIPNTTQKGNLKKLPQLYSDTSFYYLPQQQQSPGGMPVVGLNSVTLSYRGNNGNGLDIYQANIDNMYVVTPDSTFYSGMPVGSSSATAYLKPVAPGTPKAGTYSITIAPANSSYSVTIDDTPGNK